MTAAANAWFSPGRIEILGKHTDYAGGRSLLAAVDRGVTTHVRPLAAAHATQSAGPRLVARTSALPGDLTIIPGKSNRLAAGHWGNYLQAVADRLTSNFGPLEPAEVVIDSDLPLASGMSSSSALVVSVGVALAEYNGFVDHPLWKEHIHCPEDLAGYLACFENGMSFGRLAGERGVGTFGGSEDHTAMLCGHPNALVQYGFTPIVQERTIPFPDDLSLVVAVSGVAAEKTGRARELYNRASLGVREILARWNAQPGVEQAISLAAALRSSEDAPERAAQLVQGEDYLQRRLAHFLVESERLIPQAGDALLAGDLVTFGRVVDESQAQASATLGNQVPQTDYLADQARRAGAFASCSFGAGFGGSVWALVPASDADEFSTDWLERYRVQYPTEAALATTLITRPGGPLRPVE